MLNEWDFVEEEEEEDGKGILNDNIALSLERQCKEEEDGKGIWNKNKALSPFGVNATRTAIVSERCACIDVCDFSDFVINKQ